MSVHSAKGRPYRRFRLLVLATYGPTCWGCWREIDPSLPPTDPWSFQVDHDPPLSRGGVKLDITKARPMHFRCNAAKGARTATIRMSPPPSRDW